jgi:putative transposase
VFKLVHAERAYYPVAFSCRVLGVSRSGYYRWAGAGPSKRAQDDVKLTAEIRQIHGEHKGRYGSPRIHREMKERGCRVGRKRVARLMCQEGLVGRTPRRFRKTTDSRHKHRIAPNLLARDFSADAPNKAWVGDITYVPTRDGWLYLAVLLDLFSRRVVGWSMSDRIDTELALNALQMAQMQRPILVGLIHHTDRDCRYASDDYQAALSAAGMVASMSGKADCWDNAVAESFFATLEKELLSTEPLKSRKETRIEVADYIERYYNDVRRHSYIDYVSPLEFELAAS